jgi:chemotaxis protein MotA
VLGVSESRVSQLHGQALARLRGGSRCGAARGWAVARKSERSRNPAQASGSGSFDYLTLIGVTMAVGAIVGGNWLEGGHVTALLQLTAFVIVIGGTLGRGTDPDPVAGFPACPATPELDVVHAGLSSAGHTRQDPEWSRVARRDGLLALEKLVANGSRIR